MTSLFILFAFLWLFFLLPRLTTRLRNYAFTRINGKNAHHLPSKNLGVDAYQALYQSKVMTGRSHGSRLANVVWYLLAPGSHLHQEVMEESDIYHELEATTKKVMTRSAGDIKNIITECVNRYWQPENKTTYLRDSQMPVWASFFYQLVFDESCTDKETQLIVANAKNFINTTKFCEFRDMHTRYALVSMLEEKIAAGKLRVDLPSRLTTHEKALHLRGIYFTSGVSQMSEAAAHTLMCLAENRNLQQRLADTPDRFFLNNILNETFRMFPLFGVAFRIAKRDTSINGIHIDEGAVICFNYSNYQQAGYENPQIFDPDRWMSLKKIGEKFMPFGQKGNHSCPAQGVATIALGITIQMIVRESELYTGASHTRALVNRGPCLFLPRGEALPFQHARLLWMKLTDHLDLSLTSVKQLLVGAYVLLQAQKLRLASRFWLGEEPIENEPDSALTEQTAS